MSSPWLSSKTPLGPPASANPTLRQLMYAAVVTGTWSGLLCLLVYIIGTLSGVPFALVSMPDRGPLEVPWVVVLVVPLAFATLGALAASLVRGRPHAGRLVFWVGTLVALGSVAWPLRQPDAVGWSTRILLTLMHVITWALVVPQIARIVGDSEPGQFVERDENP